MGHRMKITIKNIIESMILESYIEVLRYQRLIDEWDNPKDVIQRAAVMLRDVHKIYGKFASLMYLYLVKSK